MERSKQRKSADTQGPAKKKRKSNRNDEDSVSTGTVQSTVAAEDIDMWNLIGAMESVPAVQNFEDIIHSSLDELLEAKRRHLVALSEVNHLGQKLRPLTLSEMNALHSQLQVAVLSDKENITSNLLLSKIKLDKYRRQHSIRAPRFSVNSATAIKRPDPLPEPLAPDPSIIDTLMSISSTPFANSLVFRLAGHDSPDNATYLHRDWETRSQWMELMDDIHEHYALLHPEREQSIRFAAPIDYQILREEHLRQVHDLLARKFWPGVDVSDALQNSPCQCTVIATYKKLVVGAAFVSSPQELYITYLVVRTGWESSQIATKMLHTLLTRLPTEDVILHVSANNPAMLLYNRFGFKAEEFIVGFYEDYLDHQSRASKNAFRLRLRR